MMRILIAIIILVTTSFADIKSSTNEISFDTQADHQPEMILNKTGLGIGTSPSTNLDVRGNAIISEQLLIGTNSGSSNLVLNGSLSYDIQLISSDTNLDSHSMIIAGHPSDNIILTLPAASSATGRIYKIKKNLISNQVWVDASNNIDSYNGDLELTYPEAGYSFVSLISDGTQWHTLNKSDDILNVIGADNLAGWWKLDETSGISSLDSSEEVNNLNIVDITSLGNTGIFKTSYYFDGVNDYATAGNSTSLNINEEITVSLWVNVDPTTADWGQIISKAGGTNGWYLEKRSSLNTLHLRVDTDAGFNQAFQSNSTVFDNEWHHVCFTFNRGNYTWFIDGSLDRSGSYNHGSGFSGTSNLNIGNTANEVKGFLDDIRVYNRALTTSEIEALYHQKVF